MLPQSNPVKINVFGRCAGNPQMGRQWLIKPWWIQEFSWWIHYIHQPKRDQELSIDMSEILVSNDCSIKNIEFSQIHHRFSMIFHFSRCCSLICFGHCGCQTSNQLRRGGAHPLRRGWEEFEAGRQGYGRPWAAWGASVTDGFRLGFASNKWWTMVGPDLCGWKPSVIRNTPRKSWFMELIWIYASWDHGVLNIRDEI